MKKLNKHGAKSLCAVIMAFALILLSVPVFPVHAEEVPDAAEIPEMT